MIGNEKGETNLKVPVTDIVGETETAGGGGVGMVLSPGKLGLRINH